jgi:hypothetical protein
LASEQKQVLIFVSGGVAYDTIVPEGVEVDIFDYDNWKEENDEQRMETWAALPPAFRKQIKLMIE